MAPSTSVLTIVIALSSLSQYLCNIDETHPYSTLPFETLEEQAPDTYVGNVFENEGFVLRMHINNGIQTGYRFRFLSEGYPHSKLFWIHPDTGVVRTSVVLDRESLCPSSSVRVCVLSLLLAVHDSSGTSFTIFPVAVTVMDTNDHVPKFPRSDITLSVPESTPIGTRLQVPAAIDRDSGINSVQRYKLQPENSLFTLEVRNTSLNNLDVALVLIDSLDRERTGHLSYHIIALDGGSPSLSGILDVYVTVLDANDNAPVLDKRVYNVSVQEDMSLGDVLVTLNAFDADEGFNGKLQYTFGVSTFILYGDTFKIGATTGAITLIKSLNFESTSLIELVVICTDMGEPAQSSQAVVVLHVLDVNDNKPLIHVSVVDKVAEDAEPGSIIAHVTVFDADSGRLGKVACGLNTTGVKLESVYENVYKLILLQRLDRENDRFMYLEITCQDGGGLKTINSFNIAIADVNDHSPRFDQSYYSVILMENSEQGMTIMRVYADDLDPDFGDITYELLSGPNDLFIIHPKTGEIQISGNVDRELSEKYELLVVAKDNGSPALTGTARVSIIVRDENDNAPMFTDMNYEITILENGPARQTIERVSATDADEGNNKEILYSILASTNQDDTLFAIDPKTGIIKSQISFDRERKRVYSFQIQARDGGVPSLSRKVDVVVYIEDLNDNVPVFLFPTSNNKSVTISHPVRTGMFVTKIRVFDLDSGENAKIIYEIIRDNSPSRLFTINAQSGVISINNDTLSLINGTFSLEIKVHNPGSPITVTESLEINIISNSNMITDLSEGTASVKNSEESVTSGLSVNALIVIIIISITLVIGTLILSAVCFIIKRRKITDLHLYNVSSETQRMVHGGDRTSAGSASPRTLTKEHSISDYGSDRARGNGHVGSFYPFPLEDSSNQNVIPRSLPASSYLPGKLRTFKDPPPIVEPDRTSWQPGDPYTAVVLEVLSPTQTDSCYYISFQDQQLDLCDDVIAIDEGISDTSNDVLPSHNISARDDRSSNGDGQIPVAILGSLDSGTEEFDE